MNQLAPLVVTAPQLPEIVSAAGDRAQTRFFEFFAANIRNKNTRRAYAQATREFLAWCERGRVASIADVKPCTSPPISSSSAASDPRRPSSSALLRSSLCSTGLSQARSCR